MREKALVPSRFFPSFRRAITNAVLPYVAVGLSSEKLVLPKGPAAHIDKEAFAPFLFLSWLAAADCLASAVFGLVEAD